MADEGDDEGLIVLVELAERGDFELSIESEFARWASQTDYVKRCFAVRAEGFGDVHRISKNMIILHRKIKKVKYKL